MPNEMIGSAVVEVGGQRYDNFTALQVTRDKDNLSASGTITLSWPGAEMFSAATPAKELVDGAKGTMYLDGQKVATFRIDSRTSQGTPTSFKLDLAFRGLTAALVDSQADHPSGQENKKKAPDIVKKLMEGYEPKLKDKSGGGSKQQTRFVIQEGESVERAVRRAAREFGLLARENEEGDLVLEKKGADEGTGAPLILGRHFLEWSVKRDISPRYSDVKVKGASVSTDENYGKKAEELVGKSIDSYVKFKRELHIFAESDQDKETLKKRALQEMNRRKAQGLNVTLKMSTWSDDSGQLWKVGKLHPVTIPVDQVDDTLQISTVSFTLTKDTREASITLVDKESYDDDEEGDSGLKAGGKGENIFGQGKIKSGGD